VGFRLAGAVCAAAGDPRGMFLAVDGHSHAMNFDFLFDLEDDFTCRKLGGFIRIICLPSIRLPGQNTF
jgi:hypothetical protein